MTSALIPLPPEWERRGEGTPEAFLSALPALITRLPETWLKSRRWFAGKSRHIRNIALTDHALLSSEPLAAIALVEVAYADGPTDLYSLPLTSSGGHLADASEDAGFQRLLFRLIAQSAHLGPVRFEPLLPLPAEPGPPKALGVEQSNTSIRYGRDWILKLLRRLAFGENRDLAVGRFLTCDAGFPHTPQVAGAITYAGQATLGVLQRFVDNEGDGWSFVRAELDRLTEPAPNAPDDVYWAQAGLPDRGEPLLAQIELLGRVTGEMHHALASRTDVRAFAPEPCSEADFAAWLADVEAQRSQAAIACRLPPAVMPTPAPPELAAISKIQVHGDYHLGQVLKTTGGFAIVDFEGEPARPLEERRAKQPAMRDVAGMLRSLHYAAWATALAHPDRRLEAWAEDWSKQARDRFLQGWRATSRHALDPQLLRLFLLAKAFYELNYELNNRPAWVQVPLRGIQALTRDA